MPECLCIKTTNYHLKGYENAVLIIEGTKNELSLLGGWL